VLTVQRRFTWFNDVHCCSLNSITSSSSSQLLLCTNYKRTVRQLSTPTIRYYEWVLSLLCVCLFVIHFVVLFIRLRISQRRNKKGRDILHACWPTIRTGLLPFWWTLARGDSRGGGISSGMTGSGCSWSCIIRNSARGSAGISAGIRNWGQRRCLRPCGGVCVIFRTEEHPLIGEIMSSTLTAAPLNTLPTSYIFLNGCWAGCSHNSVRFYINYFMTSRRPI